MILTNTQHDSMLTNQLPAEESSVHQVDGIVCFGGEDWWYHNQGHYDMQMMRHFSRRVPVLYVNSIGMRLPSPTEGGMFLRRIQRKLRSISRGFVLESKSFGVLSPITAPGWLDNALTRRIAVQQIRIAMKAMGITKPLAWVACPRALGLVDSLRPTAMIYQRTDRYEAFPHVNSDLISRCDHTLKQRADLTVFCAQHLMQLERAQCRSAVVVEHGVDFHHFAGAASVGREPSDIADQPRPRVGFIGSIDDHTFSADLLLAAARQLSHVQFILVGGCSLPEHWCTLPNVVQLGRKPYRDVPAYMAACDVLIMPWRRNAWIDACHPVKLKEYLAVGRPIVSTQFAELQRYGELVLTADDAAGFVGEIRNALQTSHDAAPGKALVRPFAWHRQAELLQSHLGETGIQLVEQTQMRSTPARGTVEVELKWPAESPVDDAWLCDNGLSDQTTLASRQVHSRAASHHAHHQLAACILLAGSLRPPPLVEAVKCSVLDMMLTADRSVLDSWMERFRPLLESHSVLPRVRVIHDASDFCPWPHHQHSSIVTLEREAKSHRGSAGLLRDVCAAYDAHDHVIVAESARYAACDLNDLYASHLKQGSDITIACNADCSPAGVFVIRCGSLRSIPPVGFIDLREQWIGQALVAGLRINRFALPDPGTISLRTRTDLLQACALANGTQLSEQKPALLRGSLRRRGEGCLRVICHGALIGPNASIVDSIVMPNAVVSRNAVIVRSVVGPNGFVAPGETVVDAMVPGGSQATSSSIRCA